jgi:Ca2+-binding EF-hand superfamily protein
VFDIVDRDRSGFLSKREAKRACKLIGEKFGISEVRTYLLLNSSEQPEMIYCTISKEMTVIF